MTGSPPEVGDSVTVVIEAVRACDHAIHATDARACLEPSEDGTPRLGAIYAVTPGNSGPEAGHGSLVALDCAHQHVAALARTEMQRAV